MTSARPARYPGAEAGIVILCLSAAVAGIEAQNLPYSWSPSYCTYDLAGLYPPGVYGIGFGLDNFCIYAHPDSLSWDEKRFDIWARCGIFKRTEFELKYSYPTSGLISVKWRLFEKTAGAALKLGAGYMKSTRVNMITDYIYDLYPSLIVSRRIYRSLALFIAPKLIYSYHVRDRQEHSHRQPRGIFHYGYGLGLALGENFKIMTETNWLWGKNGATDYMVNQFGLGVNLTIFDRP